MQKCILVETKKNSRNSQPSKRGGENVEETGKQKVQGSGSGEL